MLSAGIHAPSTPLPGIGSRMQRSRSEMHFSSPFTVQGCIFVSQLFVPPGGPIGFARVQLANTSVAVSDRTRKIVPRSSGRNERKNLHINRIIIAGISRKNNENSVTRAERPLPLGEREMSVMKESTGPPPLPKRWRGREVRANRNPMNDEKQK